MGVSTRIADIHKSNVYYFDGLAASGVVESVTAPNAGNRKAWSRLGEFQNPASIL
jgi:hypothetical protein